MTIFFENGIFFHKFPFIFFSKFIYIHIYKEGVAMCIGHKFKNNLEKNH